MHDTQPTFPAKSASGRHCPLPPLGSVVAGPGVLGWQGGELIVVGAGLTCMFVVLELAPLPRNGPLNRYWMMTAGTINTVITVMQLI